MINYLKKSKGKETIYHCLYIGSIITLLSFAIFKVLYTTCLYADGSNYFQLILSRQKFYLHDNSRNFILLLSQWPLVFGIDIGIKNVRVLAMLFSLGYVFWEIFYFMLTIYYSYKLKEYKFMVYTIVIFTLTHIFTGFFIMLESLAAVGIFWFLLLFFIHYTQLYNRVPKWFVCITVILSVKVYESFAFFGIVLLLTIFNKKLWKRKEKLFIFGISVLLAYASFQGFRYVIWPRDPVNAKGALQSILSLDYRLIATYLLLFIIFIFSILINYAKDTKKRKTFNNCLCFLNLVCGCWFAYLMFFNTDYIATESYNSRITNLAFPLALSLVVLFIYIKKIDFSLSRLTCVLGILLISNLWFNFKSAYDYNQHLQKTYEITSMNEGIIPANKVDLSNIKKYYWPWTMMFESVNAQMVNGVYNIKCIIIHDEWYNSWEPFDTKDILSYPDLTYYNVTYLNDTLKRHD